jgi:[ribosomal protein S5]-alanine N-acetyltransferase
VFRLIAICLLSLFLLSDRASASEVVRQCAEGYARTQIIEKIRTFRSELVGNVVTLRAVRMRDTNPLLRIYSDPVTMEYEPEAVAILQEHGETAMREHVVTRIVEQARGRGISFSVFLNQTNELVGSVSIRDIEPLSGYSVAGTVIDRRFWGKAVAAEARLLVIDFAFRELRLKKVEFEVQRRNSRNQALHEKLGIPCVRSSWVWADPSRPEVSQDIVVDVFALDAAAWPVVRNRLEIRRDEQMVR